jgi:hypothetical protein
MTAAPARETWREVVSELSRDSLVELWRSTEGKGGPHNLTGEPPMDVDEPTLAWILQHVKEALPGAGGPWVPAGLFLFHIQVSQPFVDGNHRVAWKHCRQIMGVAGFERPDSREGPLRFEGMNREGQPVNGGAGPDPNWLQAVAHDTRSREAIEWVRTHFRPQERGPGTRARATGTSTTPVPGSPARERKRER